MEDDFGQSDDSDDTSLKPLCIFIKIAFAFSRNHCATGFFPSRIRVLRSRHLRSRASCSRHCFICAMWSWIWALWSRNRASCFWNSAFCCWNRILCSLNCAQCSWNRSSYSCIRASCSSRLRSSFSCHSLTRRRRIGAMMHATPIFEEQNMLRERVGSWEVWRLGKWKRSRTLKRLRTLESEQR